MKRAIVKRFIVVLIVAMAISSIVISMSYYRLASHRVMEDMKSVLLLLDATIDWESSDLEKQIIEISSQMNNDYRITIIDNDGSVLADSETGNPETMENHKNRKEVKEAFQDGFGTKVRNSSTIKGSMMYAAYCSPTQHKVIRISIHHDVITDLMKMMVPSIAISLLLALSVAGVLTNKFAASVTKPILEISHKLEGIYDEKIDFNFPHYQYDELNIIARTTTDMSKSVQDYIRKLEKEKTIRQEFFSNASHELKTPLTAIRGYAELLQSGMASDTQMQKEFLGRIHSEVEEMTSLINDILMISRLETKELMPTKEILCVKSVAEEVKKTLKPASGDKHRICAGRQRGRRGLSGGAGQRKGRGPRGVPHGHGRKGDGRHHTAAPGRGRDRGRALCYQPHAGGPEHRGAGGFQPGAGHGSGAVQRVDGHVLHPQHRAPHRRDRGYRREDRRGKSGHAYRKQI